MSWPVVSESAGRVKDEIVGEPRNLLLHVALPVSNLIGLSGPTADNGDLVCIVVNRHGRQRAEGDLSVSTNIHQPQRTQRERLIQREIARLAAEQQLAGISVAGNFQWRIDMGDATIEQELFAFVVCGLRRSGPDGPSGRCSKPSRTGPRQKAKPA